MSERAELKRAGLKAHKNSGRGAVKADGSDDEFVVDVKEYSKSFSISQDNWAKIVTETLKVDRSKNPALMLVILAVIEWEVFEELRNNGNND